MANAVPGASVFRHRGMVADLNAAPDGFTGFDSLATNGPLFRADAAGCLQQTTAQVSAGVKARQQRATMWALGGFTGAFSRVGISSDNGATWSWGDWRPDDQDADIPWSTASLGANWSGNISYRKIGNRVDVALNVSPSASYSNTLAVIPHVPADPWPGASYISVPAGNFTSAPAIRSSLLGIETATGSVPGAIVAGVVGFIAGGYVRGYFSYYTEG